MQVTAPGKAGVNLRPLIEAIELSLLGPSVPSEAKAALLVIMDELLAPSMSKWIYPSGSPSVGSQYTIYTAHGYLTLYFASPGSFGLSVVNTSTPDEWAVGGKYNYSGSWASGSSLNCNLDVAFNGSVGNGETGDSYPAPGSLPESIDLKNQSASPVTIETAFNWTDASSTNPGPPVVDTYQHTWGIGSCLVTQDGLTDAVAAMAVTGKMIETVTDAKVMTDPGFKSNCRWDFTYAPRHTFLPFCMNNELQLKVDATPGGFVHSLGMFPPCKIFVSPKRFPAI